jgi:nicotinamide-nucleotide amidase
MIAAHGAVSAQVATAMVQGALARAPVDLAVSVTGIAGPGGATKGKPVGLVYFGIARKSGVPRVERHTFQGDRAVIRMAATERALELLLEAVRAT